MGGVGVWVGGWEGISNGNRNMTGSEKLDVETPPSGTAVRR